ncbi:hypothetical protein U9M48_040368 [Paspalum notatum var. saurae]|uniref:Uncharacterized protein n=1 Tax=Paspalum notatum var. saurae TaxID=547442 RepID=A0AAQ3XE41_PASNO
MTKTYQIRASPSFANTATKLNICPRHKAFSIQDSDLEHTVGPGAQPQPEVEVTWRSRVGGQLLAKPRTLVWWKLGVADVCSSEKACG